jgi:transposase
VDGTDNHRIFIWDNLAAHHSAYVHQTIAGRDGSRRFSIVARPQYHPKYGPIEYKICELTNILHDRKQPD